MANLASSKKNIRKSLRKRRRNKIVLEKIKTATKQGKTLTPEIQKLIDKAVKEKIVKKNKGNRLKSKLSNWKGTASAAK